MSCLSLHSDFQIKSQLLLSLEKEVVIVTKQIEELKAKKFDKECKVDDLKALMARVSQETSFLRPFYPNFNANSSNGLSKIKSFVPKSVRKYSDESHISDLSKCHSTSTNAASTNDHEEKQDNPRFRGFHKGNAFNSQIALLELGYEENGLADSAHLSSISTFWHQHLNQDYLIKS